VVGLTTNMWFDTVELHKILSAKSEYERVFVTYLLAILALMNAWINKITPESFIIHFHSFSMSVSLLYAPNLLPPPLTATLLGKILCRHGPHECTKGKLCIQYCLIDCWHIWSILIQQKLMKIQVSFQRIYHIWRFMFFLNQYQTQ